MIPGVPRDAREVYLDEKGEPIAWCPKEGLGLSDLQRGAFLSPNWPRLRELAKRAEMRTRELGHQLLVVCIDVDDPTWAFLVDQLMPGHDWNVYRSRGETPVARGIVPAEPMVKLVAEAYPAAGEVPRDRVSILVFAAGGVAIVHMDDA